MNRVSSIEVPMGNMIVASTPHILSCRGLGSCVAFVLYDDSQSIGGLAHIMLPLSNGRLHAPPAQYADRAVATLMERLRVRGADRGDVIAKIAGGASMFADDGTSRPRIGEQNIASVLRMLHKEGIQLRSADIGGNYGRSVRFDLATGKVAITSVGHGTKEI